MRKLASVEIIEKLEPIPNADRILKATIKGWECVVSKSDNFQVGDKVIYIEVDSVLPDRPEFSFLRDRKFRVKTIKLRKQISQGLILPLHYLNGKFDVGDDVTKELGIKKYDPQLEEEIKLVKRQPKARGFFAPIINYLMRFRWFRKIRGKLVAHNVDFPTYIMGKTDEERVQNMPNLFCRLQSERIPLTLTEKIEGSSATFFNNMGEFGVCSRNIWLKKEDNSYYWEVARRFQLEETLASLRKEFNAKKVVIQGEVIGQGILGNKYKISGYDIYVFNIIIDGLHLPQPELERICKQYELKTVPHVASNYIIPQSFEIADFVNVSKGKSKLLDTQEREGIVCRNVEKHISFKVLNPEYLLKDEYLLEADKEEDKDD